ncbi:splicing factor 3A subunit 3 [Diaphorina citri]|uniref:Splicing factor 3A subunit 3 n=1 Tax=Diaphorina citri TaxID=121845 RepID=A0A3Q0J385_DIACI|nr:splicing factor 3A subunit 3 [Diaphorina citri]
MSTLEERAQRLFSTKGKTALDPSLLAKSKPDKGLKSKQQERQKEIAGLEAQIYKLAEQVSEQRSATKDNVQRKQARGEGERGDSEESEAGDTSDEDDEKEAGSVLTHVGAHLDLSAFSSWEELASLGLDRLKSALMALGLKCGGTLEERAQRLFSTKGKTALDPSLLAKSKPDKGLKSKQQERQKEIAGLEAQIYKLAEQVSEQRSATKDNVQRKQARGEGERGDSEESEAGDTSDEDDEVPYNPKNLPLGWDGKPIPYWLYKLHGLNISYTCEICGNFVYKGPKAFQRHFAEWRHAHGMRCLGIPNTAHFANVTQIEDALALWEKLKAQKQEERWQPEQEEEFEDSLGNVVNRKTYEDLKRQGLL